jgi:hypothetical protein
MISILWTQGRGLPAEQRVLSPLHAPLELLTVSLDVLVDRTLDELGLLEPGHQRGVAGLELATGQAVRAWAGRRV